MKPSFTRKYIAPVLALSLLTAHPAPALADKSARSRAAGDRVFPDRDLLKASSSGDQSLRFSKARVIIDNDAAFDAKIEALNSAKPGEIVRMSYYIFSDDQSSSYFLSEMLAAARRGVEIRLTVDALTNYNKLDLFTLMEKESGGKIQVRMYGAPSNLIVRDSLFLTTPCPTYTGTPSPTFCADTKWKQISQSSPDFFSKLFLSGIFSKNGAAIQSALALGQQLDLKSFQSQESSPEDKENLKKFLKLVYEAKVKGSITAKLKVAIALSTYGETLKPILNEVYGRIPLHQMAESSGSRWEHLTDYNHQKIILAGHHTVVLGGRNIENSYHMKPNDMIAKYIFSDTDFAGEITAGGEKVADAYDQVWNFDSVMDTVGEIRALMPNDMVANSKAFGLALKTCSVQPNKTWEERQALATCLERETKNSADFKPLEVRLAELKQKIQNQRQDYLNRYAPSIRLVETWRTDSDFNDEIPSEDLSQMISAYFENLHFRRDLPANKRTRIMGASSDQNLAMGKGIHHAWSKGLENTCRKAADEKRANPNSPKLRVIFNSAYWLPSAGMVRDFGKMMDGTWDCSHVRVSIITNSFENTDLNVINIFAKYQMRSLFEVYNDRVELFGRREAARSAEFQYLEYFQPGLSLHSKVTVMGDDVLIGSANGDVRSYYMDANNGILLRNADNFTSGYINYLDRMAADPNVLRDLTDLYSSPQMSYDQMLKMDKVIIDELVKKYSFLSKLEPKTIQDLKDWQRDFAIRVAYLTKTILSVRFIRPEDRTEPRLEDSQKRLMKKFDTSLQLL